MNHGPIASLMCPVLKTTKMVEGHYSRSAESFVINISARRYTNLNNLSGALFL